MKHALVNFVVPLNVVDRLLLLIHVDKKLAVSTIPRIGKMVMYSVKELKQFREERTVERR